MHKFKERTCRLAEDGKSQWTIVRGANPSPSEIYAVEEFVGFFRDMTGVALPVADDNSSVSEYEIVIGKGSRTNSDEMDAEIDRMGDEGFIVKITEQRITIAGGKLRGTLYGVYDFLEEELGCRWYTPETTHIPQRETVRLKEGHRAFKPRLEYREVLCTYNDTTHDKHETDWFVRNRLNGQFVQYQPKHGGGIKWQGGFVHTFHSLVPLSEYYDEHPEYYSYSEAEGRRMNGKRAQLCLTNPDVLNIVVERIKGWLRDHPETTNVSVSQVDGTKPGDMFPCECPACKAVDEMEGSHSGSLLHFVNAVAEQIEKEFPLVNIDTLAYAYTTEPPKYVKARPNVIVRPCFRGDKLSDWYKVCDRLYLWDYVTNFRHYALPFPNYDLISKVLNDLLQYNIKGLFVQSTYNTQGIDFNELKTYIYAKLLWRSDRDVNQIMDEFMAAFFKNSTGPLMEYLNMLRKKIKDDRLVPMCFVNLPVSYLTKEMLRRADEIFDRAEMLAPDRPILERVQRMRLSVRFVQLMMMPKDDPLRETMIDEYFEDVTALGVRLISNRNTLPQAKKGMLEFSGIYELNEVIPVNDIVDAI